MNRLIWTFSVHAQHKGFSVLRFICYKGECVHPFQREAIFANRNLVPLSTKLFNILLNLFKNVGYSQREQSLPLKCNPLCEKGGKYFVKIIALEGVYIALLLESYKANAYKKAIISKQEYTATSL